jgi:hypothetical protein
VTDALKTNDIKFHLINASADDGYDIIAIYGE